MEPADMCELEGGTDIIFLKAHLHDLFQVDFYPRSFALGIQACRQELIHRDGEEVLDH